MELYGATTLASHNSGTKYFTIEIAALNGGIGKVTVPAPTPEAAIRESELPRQRIVRVKENVTGKYSFKKQYVKPMSLVDQSLIVGQVATGMAQQNSLPMNVFNRILHLNPQYIHYLCAVKGCQTVAEFLRALNIDKDAIFLAKVGDDSGEHYQALVDAAELLRVKAKSSSVLRGPLIMALVYGTVSLTAIIAFGLIGHNVISMLIDANMVASLNNLSWFFYYLGKTLINGWPLVLAVIVSVIFFRKWIIEKSRTWPIIRNVYELAAISRATVFAVTVTRLVKVDSAQNIIQQMVNNASNRDKPIYEKVLDRIRAGSTIAESLAPQSWPPELIMTLDGIENSTKANVKLSLDRLLPNLYDKAGAVSSALTNKVIAIGLGTAVLTAGGVFIGVYVPLMTLKNGAGI